MHQLLNGGSLSPIHLNASQLKSSYLPSFTYTSPVNIGRYPFYNPLMAIDWKWRLLQAHTTLYETRFNRSSGFLFNLDVEKTVRPSLTPFFSFLAWPTSK
jgi:hypothetical protein